MLVYVSQWETTEYIINTGAGDTGSCQSHDILEIKLWFPEDRKCF